MSFVTLLIISEQKKNRTRQNQRRHSINVDRGITTIISETHFDLRTQKKSAHSLIFTLWMGRMVVVCALNHIDRRRTFCSVCKYSSRRDVFFFTFVVDEWWHFWWAIWNECVLFGSIFFVIVRNKFYLIWFECGLSLSEFASSLRCIHETRQLCYLFKN